MGTFIDKVKKAFQLTPFHYHSTRSRAWIRRQIMMLSNHPLAWMNQNSFKKKIPFHVISKHHKVSREAGGGVLGKMYLFKYDPKYKETLPYYDIYPLIFIIDPDYPGVDSPGFLGINFHYLDMKSRFQLLDDLMTLKTDQNYDQNTRLKISYQILKKYSRDGRYKACIKHYLTTHVQSRLLEISADEWDIALALPVQQFKKKSDSDVWRESKRKF